MIKISKITGKSIGKSISITVMCACLFLLTVSNFIIYPPQSVAHASLAHNNESNDEESPAPVEEKSSTKTGLSAQEEYIHDQHTIKDLSAVISSSKYKIPAVEKLQIVHFERDSPPPKA